MEVHHPAMMRVALSTDHLAVRIEEMEVPEPGPGEIRIAIRVCGACTSDVLDWYVREKAPVVLGHEPVGIVDKLGEGVESPPVGTRVFVHHHAPCGECRDCRRGKPILCAVWRKQALHPGGFAEKAVVRPQAVRNDTLEIPDTMTDEAAALIEPFACSIHAVKTGGVGPGSRVALVGMGGMGFLNAYGALSFGADQLAVTDLMPERLAMAEEQGLGHVIDGRDPGCAEEIRSALGGEGADVVIVGPGSTEAMRLGMNVASPGSRVVLFTPTGRDERLSVSPHQLYFKDITLTTSYSCDPSDTREAIRRIADGALPAEKVITHRYPLEDLQEALTILKRGGAVLKVVITVDGGISPAGDAGNRDQSSDAS